MMRDAADPSEPTLADPPPRFATADEIELADRLRRKIEERYLGAAAEPRPPGSRTVLHS
ncbi:MAG: hypothetical protein U1F48_03850 [Burkholderiales bacterium]